MVKAPFQGSRDEPGVGPAFAVSERKKTRCYLVSNRVRMCVYASLCMCVCACMCVRGVYMHVCMCVCMCVCAYACEKQDTPRTIS